MSKHQAIRTIRAEIDRLNKAIDLRIIRGLPYRQLAIRHKSLMAQLRQMSPRTSWIKNPFHFVTTLMF